MEVILVLQLQKQLQEIGTIGLDLIAPPVAIAAETPQIEIPEASGAAHSLLNLKYFLAMK